MRILIIDDHPLFREVLNQHLQDLFAADFTAIFEVATAEEAQALVAYKNFDLIFLDINLSGMNGITALPLLRSTAKDAAIIVISGSHNSNLAKIVIDQGANGFISKATSAHEIENAIKLVLSGEVYISPSMLATHGNNEGDFSTTKKSQVNLTPRQKEVFQLMSEGLPNKSIASRLNCTEGTVKLHVSAILHRLKVRNRTEAVMEAATLDW